MRKYAAEALATFVLVFCGTGAIVIDQETGGLVSHPAISITFGCAVTLMIYALGDISGSHMNPAVTIAFWLSKRFRFQQLLPYVTAQCAGAVAASLLLSLLFPDNNNLGRTLPALPLWQAFAIELFLSFFLMIVILSVSSGSKERGMFAGLMIGVVVMLEALIGGPLSGASMNPARSLGPAVVSGTMRELWLYIFSSVAGMSLAIPAWNYSQKSK